MPRRYYTPEQKRLALDRLIANNGDVDLTALQTGIPERTFARWKQQAVRNGTQMPILPMPSVPPKPPITSLPPLYTGEGRGGGSPLQTEVSTSLRDLQTQMLTDAHVLAQSIQDAIPDAPLGQRVAALAQLIDRIIKLAAQLPSEPDELIVHFAGHVAREDDHENRDDDPSTETASQPAEDY